MKIDTFKKLMERNNFVVNEQNVTKGNITMHGIVIRRQGENVGATFYDEAIEAFDMDDELVVQQVENALNDGKMFNNFECTRQLIEDNVILYLGALTTRDDIATRQFLDMSVLYRCILGNNASFLVTKAILDHVGMTEDELFEAAKKNSADAHRIIGMGAMMMELMSGEAVDLPDDINEKMYVASSRNSVGFGTGILLYNDKLADFCKLHNVDKIVIIPSSIHEVLFIIDDEATADAYSSMITEVNATEVKPEEVLSNHAYVYNVSTNTVEGM